MTVDLIVPARIRTDRTKLLEEERAKREGRQAEDVSAESTRSIPIGRDGEPEEYAQVVAFLTSTCASYVTGAVSRVDGILIASI